MRDLVSNLRILQALVPAVLSATATSEAIDLLGAGSAAVLINTGAIVSSGNFTPKLQESANGSSDWADVATDDLQGGFPAVLAENSQYKIGYHGRHRFIRTVLTLNSGTSIAASVIVATSNLSRASA